MTIYVTFKGHKIEDGKPKEGGQVFKGLSEPLSEAELFAIGNRLMSDHGLDDVYVQTWQTLTEEQSDGD